MALSVSWSKAWSNSDNGGYLTGGDLGTVQSDIQSALANGAALNGVNSWSALQTFNAGVKPAYVILPLQTAAPTTSSNEGGLYVKTASSVDELFYRMESNGTEVQITKNGSVKGFFDSALVHIRDEKAANTDGGTFTSGAWQTRTLNTVKTNEITGASLASNKLTLPAGTYFAFASAPAGIVQEHKIRLYNTTDASTVIAGQNAGAGSTGGSTFVPATLSGRFTLSGTKDLELQHRCGTTRATDGFGLKTNWGEVEVYAELIIWKVA